MSLPSKPIRKPAKIGTDNLARPTSGGIAKSEYRRKTATSAQASKSTYDRKGSGIAPGKQPINDKDAGKGIGNVRK